MRTTTTKETASRLLPYAHEVYAPSYIMDEDGLDGEDVFCEHCARSHSNQLRRDYDCDYDDDDIGYRSLEFDKETMFYEAKTCCECDTKLACRVRYLESVPNGEVWTEADWDKADEEVSQM